MSIKVEDAKKEIKKTQIKRKMNESERDLANKIALRKMKVHYPNLKSGRQRPRNKVERRILESWATTGEELEKIQARSRNTKK